MNRAFSGDLNLNTTELRQVPGPISTSAFLANVHEMRTIACS